MFAAVNACLSRVRAFLAGRREDEEFERELDFHIAALTDEYIAQGIPEHDARRRAAMRVGSRTALSQRHREGRGLPIVESFIQDLRFALRMIAKERWLTVTIVATLAVGMGANSMGFTVLDATLFRRLPFEEPHDIYTLTWRSDAGRRIDVTPRELANWQLQARSFEDLAGFATADFGVTDSHGADQVSGVWVTSNAFAVLRQRVLLGRDFVAGDERAHAYAVMLSHDLWQTRYRADPRVLGTSIRLDRRPATVIGVMPASMNFPDNGALWVALPHDSPAVAPDARKLTIYGRLARDATRARATAEFAAIAAQARAAMPDTYGAIVGINVETFNEAFIGGVGRVLFLTVMAAVTLVLMISCGNVANLLLSRSTTRAREVALRMSLGATRRRVIRQLLTESAVLAFFGGIGGLLLAKVGIDAFRQAMSESGLPYWVRFELDGLVFVYIAALCVVTTVIFGLAPAMLISKRNAHAVLKESSLTMQGSDRQRWLSGALVVSQITLTMVLLAGAGLVVRSFLKLYVIDVGIETANLSAQRLRLPADTYESAEARRAFFNRLNDRLAAIAGVEASAITTGVPPFDGGERLVEVDGVQATMPPRFASVVAITGPFFDVVRRPLLRGRTFGARDADPRSEAVVIVNERMAELFFDGQDPIGRRIRFAQRQSQPDRPPEVWRTVVGVAAPIRHGSSVDQYLSAVVYTPILHDPPSSASMLIRSALTPARLAAAVRREVRALDPDQSVMPVETIEQLLARDRWIHRVFGSLFAVLAAIALAVSFVGVYAVMSYAVLQRKQEIGVRMAIGASRTAIVRLVLARGMTQVALAIPCGIVGGVGAGVVLERLLVGMTPVDPATLLSIVVLLVVVTIAACLVPARRATRIDPMASLRAE
jgi:putative ABC transport system permease protein